MNKIVLVSAMSIFLLSGVAKGFEVSDPVLIRSFECKAKVSKYENEKKVPNTDYELVFTVKDYKSVITWSSGNTEDSYVANLELESHPEGTSQKLYGEFASNGGENVNEERDGDPRGRGGWQGLSWYELRATKPSDQLEEEQTEVSRLFLKAKKKQVDAKVRKYNAMLRYWNPDQEAENDIRAEYRGTNATCVLVE
jgi:hypothetical protein